MGHQRLQCDLSFGKVVLGLQPFCRYQYVTSMGRKAATGTQECQAKGGGMLPTLHNVWDSNKCSELFVAIEASELSCSAFFLETVKG